MKGQSCKLTATKAAEFVEKASPYELILDHITALRNFVGGQIHPQAKPLLKITDPLPPCAEQCVGVIF